MTAATSESGPAGAKPGNPGVSGRPGGEVVVYRTEDGRSRIEVRLDGDSVWLSQALMADLFQTTKQNVSLHLKNIFVEGELVEERVVKDYLTTAADGKNYLDAAERTLARAVALAPADYDLPRDNLNSIREERTKRSTPRGRRVRSIPP